MRITVHESFILYCTVVHKVMHNGVSFLGCAFLYSCSRTVHEQFLRYIEFMAELQVCRPIQ